MHIQLSDYFNFNKLLRFSLPSIIMMVFTSLYSIVDGFFVSNFVGKTPFAAVNLIMPVIMILSSVGFMFGTGGGALVSKTMGEGCYEKAQRLFSLFVYCTAISQILGGIIPIIYFSRSNSSLLRLTKTSIDGNALFKACTNGSSELMSNNISTSIVSMLYNVQLMKYAGENGIAAYGVLCI